MTSLELLFSGQDIPADAVFHLDEALMAVHATDLPKEHALTVLDYLNARLLHASEPLTPACKDALQRLADDLNDMRFGLNSSPGALG